MIKSCTVTALLVCADWQVAYVVNTVEGFGGEKTENKCSEILFQNHQRAHNAGFFLTEVLVPKPIATNRKVCSTKLNPGISFGLPLALHGSFDRA